MPLTVVSFCVLFLLGACHADRESYDCKMKQLALDYARKIQPFRTKEQFQQVADALNGADESQKCNVSVNMLDDGGQKPPSFSSVPKNMVSMFYVDAKKGSDSNSGTMSSPFGTIAKAINASRSVGQPSTIILREGTFYITDTIQLGPKDSGLTIMNYQSEEVWISGAKRITTKWTPVSTSGGKNIYMADISSEGLREILGLRVNGKRGIRARYPNADPELGFGSEVRANSWLKPTLPTQPVKEINPSEPYRGSGGMFQMYQLGIGGPCENFYPPAGYWCGSKTEGGGAFTYTIPSGMVADRSKLPNQPYKNATGAIVQTWRPAHWASWMFEVGKYDEKTSTFEFSKGGFQGARGNKNGDVLYIENVMEELDYPNEWYYDSRAGMLYFFYNATSGTPPSEDTVFEAVQLKSIVIAQGSQESPVKDLSIMGVNFKDTAYTYMDPHGMPSGGDWGLERTGVLYFEGTVNTIVDSCIFQRLDGNAIMLSGYNRNATIQKNEFVWIGSSAIAQWGYTTGVDGVLGMGWDGIDGNQPRFSRILYNFVHELGIWEKQSSFYFQAKSCQNLIMGNIFFNGPRAGINFNDGFGGGSNVTENLLFNTCRESGDHGPFNSWDRQVFVTKVRNGTATTEKQYDYISYNFIIANYNSKMGIDNDDGSAYYETHHNFFTYGSLGGMKSNFGGHDNHQHNNIYGYINEGFHIITKQEKGHENKFYNNSIVLNKDGNYGSGQACSGDGMTVVHDNKIYTPNGKVTECGMDLDKWQAKGNDPGTTANKWPSDEELLGMVKELLSII